MLKKIIGLKNTGKFTDDGCCGAVDFKRWNIIFAENGRGKSTLASLLKSVGDNNPKYLLARQTLGQSDSPTAKLLFDIGGNGTATIAKFENAQWDVTPQPVLVFDQSFIDDNVFIGGKVDYAQRRGLYEVFVGRQTGSLVSQISDEDEAIRGLNATISTVQAVIREHIKSGLTIDRFIALENKQDIEQDIQALELKLSNMENKTKVLEAPLLQPVIFTPPDFTELRDALATSIATLSAETAEAVKGHITAIGSGRAEQWLEYGHELCANTEGKCPYCGQSLEPSAIASLYGEYFNREYTEALKRLNDLKGELGQALNVSPVLAIGSRVTSNQTQFDYWQKTGVEDLQPLQFESDSLQACLLELQRLVNDEIEAKLKSPLEERQLPEQLTDAIDRLAAKVREIEIYNETELANNEKIKAFRDNLRTDTDVSGTRSQLYAAYDVRSRHTESVSGRCDEYTRLLGDKKTHETTKTSLRRQLDASSAELLNAHLGQINECLERSGADFRIERINQSHVGGRPNSTFILKLNGEEIAADADADDAPSVRTALSAGDKTTLAFAIFVSCVKNDTNIASSLVAIDDPISSLDYYRRNYTLDIIYDLFNSCEQGILLSHDADFLHGMWTRMGSNTDYRTSMRIRRQGQCSKLKPWDVEKHAETEQKNRISMLQKFADEGLEDGMTLITVASTIRPMLEHAYKAIYVKEFPSSATLGDFIGRVRTSTDDYMVNIQGRLDRLTAVNSYATSYSSHDRSQTTPPINETELTTNVKEALALIRS